LPLNLPLAASSTAALLPARRHRWQLVPAV